jgi:hypothetical protein
METILLPGQEVRTQPAFRVNRRESGSQERKTALLESGPCHELSGQRLSEDLYSSFSG